MIQERNREAARWLQEPLDWEEEAETGPNPGTAAPFEDAPVIYYMGRRIYFRSPEPEDEPLLRRWVNDPRVWSTLKFRGPRNAIHQREWIESLGKTRTEHTFGIVVRETDRLIGTAGLHGIDPFNRSATFGLCIGDAAFRGKGYGTEATRLAMRYGFQELNLNRIELSVFGHNWRAIRVYQKCGFVHEGCLRQAVYRHGQYQDEYKFAILREEWNRLAGADGPDSTWIGGWAE